MAGMETLVTILCRAGSKGLPHKNIKLLCGKPLVQHTIDKGMEWIRENQNDAVLVVSSDDPEVERIAAKNNLHFIHRPKKLATSKAGKIESIRHAFKWAERKFKRQFEVTLDLDVCNPMRRTYDIEAVYGHMLYGKRHHGSPPLSVFSVTKSRRNPYFNMWPRTTEGILSLTRQEAPQMYDINSNVYGYSREFMLSDRQHPITERSEIYEMPEWSFCDIDTELDFSICRFLMEEFSEELGTAGMRKRLDE